MLLTPQSPMPSTEVIRDGIENRAYQRVFTELEKPPRYKRLLSEQAVVEGYSVGEHSRTTVDIFDQHFSNTSTIKVFPHNSMRVHLIGHDFGKGVEPDRANQHQNTLFVYEELQDSMPTFSADPVFEKKFARSLVDQDIMGPLFMEVRTSFPTFEEKILLALFKANHIP